VDPISGNILFVFYGEILSRYGLQVVLQVGDGLLHHGVIHPLGKNGAVVEDIGLCNSQDREKTTKEQQMFFQHKICLERETGVEIV
jgi:hypothetical protein